MAGDRLTWLHCSDFHVGKDRTAQERLLGKIVEHGPEQVATGCVPDRVFITGDLANRGVNPVYKAFNQGFIVPLREALGGNTWQGRILAVPGNDDVERSKANAFDRDGVLAPGTCFFDPSGEGKGCAPDPVPPVQGLSPKGRRRPVRQLDQRRRGRLCREHRRARHQGRHCRRQHRLAFQGRQG